MSKPLLPFDVHYGGVRKPIDWRAMADPHDVDDDEELSESPRGLVAVLGFDPASKRANRFETGHPPYNSDMERGADGKFGSGGGSGKAFDVDKFHAQAVAAFESHSQKWKNLSDKMNSLREQKAAQLRFIDRSASTLDEYDKEIEARVAPLNAELDQVKYELNSMGEDSSGRQQIWDMLKTDTPSPVRTYIIEAREMPSHQQAVVSKARDWLSNHVSTKALAETTDIRRDPDSYRSNANWSGITLGKYAAEEDTIHEFGHMIEARDSNVLRAFKAYLESRCSGNPEKSMNELSGSSGYNSWEKGREGGFMSAYFGKSYPNATEILSMGLQEMYKHPGRFAVKDPETFKYVTKVMKGKV